MLVERLYHVEIDTNMTDIVNSVVPIPMHDRRELPTRLETHHPPPHVLKRAVTALQQMRVELNAKTVGECMAEWLNVGLFA